MTFRVETTAAAEQDADAILEWLLSEHAGETGLDWFAALQDLRVSCRIPGALSASSGKRGLSFRGSSSALWPKAARVSDSVHD